MQILTLSVVASSLLTVCFAAPADDPALVPRQTYTITCIGTHCNDGSDSTPTPAPSSSSTSTTSPTPYIPRTTRYRPPPSSQNTPTPSKTTKVTVQPSQTGGEEVGPSSTRCPVPVYYKCGGSDDHVPWTGCTTCVKGATCVMQNEWYYQCVPDDGTL